MYKLKKHIIIGFAATALYLSSCKFPQLMEVKENSTTPVSFDTTANIDSINMANQQWRTFFTDKNLVNLIDTALKNNQELLITLQEIEISRNEIRMRHGNILPTVGYGAGAGIEKVGRYTSQGAGDASTDITPGEEVPEVLTDYKFGLVANWEVDVWKKLRTAKKAVITRYLATLEGRNFLVTNLVSEIASSYYELLALDNQLEIVKQNIGLQKNALEVVKIQKEAARATELAVQKFQAEVLKSQGLEFDILQKIKEAENNINMLLGRYPTHIPRPTTSFMDLQPAAVSAGIPSQLLANRPDIKQAELELAASKLDVKVARAEFYPSFGISAALGFQAFKPSYLIKFPESVFYSLAGDLAGPLINRNGIKAEFANANAKQLQAMYNYERTILNAYLEVNTKLSSISNLKKSFDIKSKQVDALTRAIDVSSDLFKSARADYFEVLMTQRDVLEAKLELIETKKNQLTAAIGVYKGLGGGWR